MPHFFGLSRGMVFLCCKRPGAQRRLRVLVLILSFLSWVFSFVSIRKCTFVMSGTEGMMSSQFYGWGLFTMSVYDSELNLQGCVPYSTTAHLGSALKTAQAFGILLTICTTATFLMLTLTHFFLPKGGETVFHLVRVLLPAAFCCQLLTFSAFASSLCDEFITEEDVQYATKCAPGGAAAVAIFNMVTIVMVGSLMSITTPAPQPVFRLNTAEDLKYVHSPPTMAHTISGEEPTEMPFTELHFRMEDGVDCEVPFDEQNAHHYEARVNLERHNEFSTVSDQVLTSASEPSFRRFEEDNDGAMVPINQQPRAKSNDTANVPKEHRRKHRKKALPDSIFRLDRDTEDKKGKKSKSKEHHSKRPIHNPQQISLQEPRRPGQQETVKVTIIDTPQARQTIREVTHPDGSKTITTTVEEESFLDEEVGLPT